MHILKTEFYDGFFCTADQCPYNCCQDWEIDIDSLTYEKYKNIEDIKQHCFEPTVQNLVAEIKMTHANECPFLDERGLCKIVKKYGDEMLSVACTFFPRRKHRRGDIEERSLSNGCPEVLNILKRQTDSIEFLLEDMGVEERGYTSSVCEDILVQCRDFVIDLLQIKEFPLWFRLYIVYMFADKVKTNTECVEDYIKQYSNVEEVIGMYQLVLNMESNIDFKVNQLVQMFFVFNPDESLSNKKIFKKYIKPLKEKVVNQEMAGLIAKWQEFENVWETKLDFIENICVNNIFCTGLKQGSYDHFGYSIYAMLVEVMLIQITMFLQWFYKEETLCEEEWIKVISYYARNIEHNDKFCENVKGLEQEGWFEMGKIFLFLR